MRLHGFYPRGGHSAKNRNNYTISEVLCAAARPSKSCSKRWYRTQGSSGGKTHNYLPLLSAKPLLNLNAILEIHFSQPVPAGVYINV
jgi:hypothetical protein